MKREDVKNKIPGITDEQLNWLMQENGADINREKSAATALQTQLNNVNAQLKTAQEGLAKFDGKKKPEEYEAELAKLQADLKAQADGFAFDNALDTAILGKKGRIARQQPRGSVRFRGCFCIYWSIRMRSSCTTSCSARQIRSTSGELSIAPAACMRLMSCCALASAAQICVRFSSEIFMIITILF